MKLLLKNDKFWMFSSLVSLSILYLNLTWKTTGDIDRITTDSLFWAAILWLLWRRRDKLSLDNDFCSNLVGLLLIVLVLFKSISLFSFESQFISFFPFFAGFGFALIASGWKSLCKYWQELLLIGIIFFPSEVVGWWINKQFQVAVLTAKFSAYFLYYIGFQTTSQSHEVLLSLPEKGNFVASVNYGCTGVSMIILMFKLSVLVISFFSLKFKQRFFLLMLPVGIGFVLGMIRVSILTVFLPEPAKFDYWHGSEGAQIFSTLAILIFSFFCHLVLTQQNLLNPSQQQQKTRNLET